jgi:hypothetical protein
MKRSVLACSMTALVALTATAMAQQSPKALEAALADMRVACDAAPSAVCANRAAALFDADGDGSVSRDEMAAGTHRMRVAAQSVSSPFNDGERLMVALAMAALDRAGPQQVFDGFDANGDGRLDRAEMFADFRLDQRPFNQLVADPEAVDWPGFAARFGETGKLFLPLLPVAGSARDAR